MSEVFPACPSCGKTNQAPAPQDVTPEQLMERINAQARAQQALQAQQAAQQAPPPPQNDAALVRLLAAFQGLQQPAPQAPATVPNPADEIDVQTVMDLITDLHTDHQVLVEDHGKGQLDASLVSVMRTMLKKGFEVTLSWPDHEVRLLKVAVAKPRPAEANTVLKDGQTIPGVVVQPYPVDSGGTGSAGGFISPVLSRLAQDHPAGG